MTAIAALPTPAVPANRIMIMASVMLGTVLTMLDIAIANVVLPHIAGAVSASLEEVSWVLTSYLVASAIMTPVTGWLSNRLGRKRLLIITVTGFIVTSALCGASQTLFEIVFFRVLQGAFAAPMQPLSQAIVLDLFTVSERGGAMAAWSMCTALGPICGPFLGAWIADTLNWRWVFFINLPLGILSLLGVLTFVARDEKKQAQPFGLMGFALLSIAVAALQLMCDRGQMRGWFESSEIVIEAAVAFIAFWFFLVQSGTGSRPFLPPRMFRDHNLVIATIISFVIPAVILAGNALIPTMLQGAYGFPVVTAGLLTATRGLGGALAMFAGSFLMSRIGIRPMMTGGLVIFSLSFYWMSHFTLDTSETELAVTGVIQGMGMSIIYLGMINAAFITLAPEYRGDATGVLALGRNLGGGIGISVALAMWTNFSAGARSLLAAPFSLNSSTVHASLPAQFSLTDPVGVAMLSNEVDRQASMVAFTQVFYVMCFAVAAVAPLLLLLRIPKAEKAKAETASAK